ncbi:MAG: hypothetical protein V5804_13010, partial [Mucilaginibacter sp.]|uniref:hypothetical protein n=1 Tax=Mucilaginibacter sp. TaxID=1882438 RepID=UPI0034E3F19B
WQAIRLIALPPFSPVATSSFQAFAPLAEADAKIKSFFALAKSFLRKNFKDSLNAFQPKPLTPSPLDPCYPFSP